MEKEKLLVVFHGDKGGVGKSLGAMLAIDYLMYQGCPVTVVEGDTHIGDVATRFHGADGVNILNVNLDASGPDAENAVNRLFGEIERANSAAVVLNAPANSFKSLDAHADLIAPIAQELGYKIHLAWMIGPSTESAALANQSAMAAVADRRIALVNRGLVPGASLDHFAWYSARHPEYRQAWLDNGGLEGEIPSLLSDVMGEVVSRTGQFSTLAKPADRPQDGLPGVASRHALWRWLNNAWDRGIRSLIEDDAGGASHE